MLKQEMLKQVQQDVTHYKASCLPELVSGSQVSF